MWSIYRMPTVIQTNQYCVHMQLLEIYTTERRKIADIFVSKNSLFSFKILKKWTKYTANTSVKRVFGNTAFDDHEYIKFQSSENGKIIRLKCLYFPGFSAACNAHATASFDAPSAVSTTTAPIPTTTIPATATIPTRTTYWWLSISTRWPKLWISARSTRTTPSRTGTDCFTTCWNGWSK